MCRVINNAVIQSHIVIIAAIHTRVPNKRRITAWTNRAQAPAGRLAMQRPQRGGVTVTKFF